MDSIVVNLYLWETLGQLSQFSGFKMKWTCLALREKSWVFLANFWKRLESCEKKNSLEKSGKEVQGKRQIPKKVFCPCLKVDP